MEILAIGVAFVFGLGVLQLGLPPLVGYLVAGFILFGLGMQSTPTLNLFSELGVTLLLFTIGLKLRLRSLLMPQIWGVAGLHMLLVGVLLAAVLWLVGVAGLAIFSGLSPQAVALIAFALSFSSTVFAVKVLEENGEMSSLYGRIAIGVLIVQDIAAVVFLAVFAGKMPSYWALLLLALIPLRPLLHLLLARSGHGELQIMFGLSLALGGALVFEAVGMKGDLGALILGTLLAGSARAPELAKSLLAFKDLFLVGFFLTIGLAGGLSLHALGIALLLVLLVPLKAALFFILFTRFRLRARSAFLASLGLANYSEFGLIVGAVAVANGWLAAEWLAILAIALALSFLFSAPLNNASHAVYGHLRERLLRLESGRRLAEEARIEPGPATVLILGMGRVGCGAYNNLSQRLGDVVLGIDQNAQTVERHRARGWRVILGSSTDPEFWERISMDFDSLCLVMLAMPTQRENLEAARQLKRTGYTGFIAAIARFPDEIPQLRAAGVNFAVDLYAEAGSGFADDVWHAVEPCLLGRQQADDNPA